MKKLLVGTAAIALALAIAAPAKAADGVKLSLGGHFKGYVTWLDQDEDIDTDGGDAASESARSFDILRDTEIHFTGETTLDNGLTVGFHSEALADAGAAGTSDTFDVQESYAYFSGMWGRVNFGAEDGAAYLLQVAAPSADSNYDGIRQYVQPVNYALTLANPGGIFNDVLANALANWPSVSGEGFDYDQDLTGYANKITYMTPVWNGFQAGVSYTPEVLSGPNSLGGVNPDEFDNNFGDGWDLALRYEGMFDKVGVTLGGGYSYVNMMDDTAAAPVAHAFDEDRQAWNVGANLAWGAFNLGAIYMTDDNGYDLDNNTDTWDVGLDYTTGPFKLGVSYFDQSQEVDGWAATANSGDIDTHRYTGGVVYTYGPGMTFRGSVAYIDHNFDAQIGEQDTNATSLLLGTQINF